MLKGVILSVMASLTFGVLYFYTQLLGQLDSEQTFGWRIIATLPFLTLFMWWSGDLSHIKNISTYFSETFFTSITHYNIRFDFGAVMAVFMGAYAWTWFASFFGIFPVTACFGFSG
ncbi:hypothetical protein MASRES_GEN12945_13640 [Acinetobacter baumannii]